MFEKYEVLEDSQLRRIRAFEFSYPGDVVESVVTRSHHQLANGPVLKSDQSIGISPR